MGFYCQKRPARLIKQYKTQLKILQKSESLWQIKHQKRKAAREAASEKKRQEDDAARQQSGVKIIWKQQNENSCQRESVQTKAVKKRQGQDEYKHHEVKLSVKRHNIEEQQRLLNRANARVLRRKAATASVLKIGTHLGVAFDDLKMPTFRIQSTFQTKSNQIVKKF